MHRDSQLAPGAYQLVRDRHIPRSAGEDDVEATHTEILGEPTPRVDRPRPLLEVRTAGPEMEHHVGPVEWSSGALRQPNLGFTLRFETNLAQQPTVVLDLVTSTVIDDDVVGEVTMLARRAQSDCDLCARQRS